LLSALRDLGNVRSLVCGDCWLTDFGDVGAAGGVGAALTGDREKQEKYQQMHDDAKTQLRSAQGDIQKQAEAEAKANQ
jgi:hypothetical protein